jgi:hypothetical protein
VCEITKERLLKELEILMIIPNFKGSIYHKMQELKTIMKEDIKRFNETLRMLESVDTIDLNKGVHFTIEKSDDEWIPSIPGIPGEIIDFISSYNSSVINMLNDVEIDGRKYAIHFEWKEPGLIDVLLLRANLEKKKQTSSLKSGKMENLKLLFQYLLNNESLCDSVLSEFLSTWKPLVDSSCMSQTNAM